MDGQTDRSSTALHPRWESYSPITARSQLPPTAPGDIANVPETLFCQFPIPTAHRNALPGPWCSSEPALSSWMGWSAPTTQPQPGAASEHLTLTQLRGTATLTPPPPPTEEGQGLCSPSPRGQKAGGLLSLTRQRLRQAGKHQRRGRGHAAVLSGIQGDHLPTRVEVSAPKSSRKSGRFGLLRCPGSSGIPQGWQGLGGAPSCLSPPCLHGLCRPWDNVPRGFSSSVRAWCRLGRDPCRLATPGTVALRSLSLQPRRSRNGHCSISAMPEGQNSSPHRTAQPAAPPGSGTMMDGVKWSAGEGKHARCSDSSELPPTGTQWATKPRPAGRAGSPITCPIKKQIEQRAS